MKRWSLALLLAAATADAAVNAVLVKQNGDVTRKVLEGCLTEPGLDHAWIWTDDLPPLRIDQEVLRTTDDLTKLLRPAAATRALRFVRQNGKVVREVRVIAAPVAMWLEVPEDLLPTQIAADGRLALKRGEGDCRLRAISAGLSSDWIDAGGATNVTLVPAKDVVVRATEPDGKRVSPSLRMVESPRGVRDARLIALFAPSRDGAVHVPSAPPMIGTVFVDAPDHVPTVLAQVALSELPSPIVVAPGATLLGRCATPRGDAVPSASIDVEWWAPGNVAHLVKRSTQTNAEGRFIVRGVAKGPLALSVAGAGLAPSMRQLDISEELTDLGLVRLVPPSTIRLRMIDEARHAVAGISVAGSPREFVSDRNGIMTVSGIDASAPFRRLARAAGYLPALIDLAPPLPAEAVVSMRRSYRVRGRFMAADGPVDGAALLVKVDKRESNRDIASDGTFDLDVEPDKPIELAFSSAATATHRVAVAAGRPGEVRDLGEVRVPAGSAIRGRVVGSDDLQPVSGASVWTLAASQPVMAWARGQTIHSESEADGAFALRGADPAPALLRIDAPNYARSYVTVPARPAGDYDAGEMVLSHGATLHVRTDDEADDAVVRVDLRGEGFEADMLTATLHGSAASVPHVPAGRAVVTVEQRNDVLCEQTVTIASDDSDVDVRCSLDHVLVRGRVLVAGRPSSGMLRWERDLAPTDAVILTTSSPGGITQQRAIGRGTPTVSLFVTDGRFESATLRPGKWRVSWLPDSGGGAGAREVMLGDAKEQEVTLEYGGASIRGIVVDRDDAPVARAFVSIAGTNEGTDSAPDGSFILTGLSAGEYRVRARERNRVSEPIAVQVDGDREAGIVRLRVDRPAANDTTITIRRRDGAPAAGAVAIIETDAGLSLTLTSDGDGLVHAQMPIDAHRTRVAALSDGAFALTEWGSAGDRLVQFGETGGMTIVSAREAPPSIVSADGWDIAALLRRFGAQLIAAKDRPVELRGLPAGSYAVASDEFRRVVTVRAGDVALVKLQNP